MISMQEVLDNVSNKVEFVQAITIDINGLARGKMFPRKKITALLEGKEEVVGLLEVYGTKCEIPFSIKEISDTGFRNKYIVPDVGSFRVAPWCNDDSLAMVFFDTYDIATNRPWPFGPRHLAKLKLKELEDTGYKLLCGVENEFRLFNKTTMEPIFKVINQAGNFLATTAVLPFVRRLNEKLMSQDIEMDSWNLEYGKAQVEIPLRPYLGFEGLDKVWIFRELSKYVADDMGMVASYMTSPLANDSASGMHINHSLVRCVDMVNVMQSDDGDGKLSELGQHWLAGLIKHSRALTAFTSPTVNCYRRIRSGGFAPTLATWNYCERNVGYRVKTSALVNNKNYIENRMPSSACNIYLAISAMIVAGLDGIRNELKLIEPGNGCNCESFPLCLEDALEALEQDTVLKEGLGETFVDWYIKAKTECDVNVLKKGFWTSDSAERLEEEFQKYIML